MEPGDVIGSRFCVEALAGAGGMGAVYRARDRATGSAVALKVLRALAFAIATPNREALLPTIDQERFAREARLLAQLDHPSIVRYIAHGFTAAGEPYLVMEWVEGESLEQRLARGGLEDAEAVLVAERVAAALGFLHQANIVHRDVKPGNVMLTARGIKLVDFGIARAAARPSALTGTNNPIGTLRYMAPEQATGEDTVGPPADVFAVGAMLFRALTGRAPYDAPQPMEILGRILLEEPPRLVDARADLPEELLEVVDRMLAKAPAARHADGAAAAHALCEARASLGAARVSLPPASRAQTITEAERRVVSVVAVTGEPDVTARARLAIAPYGAQLAMVDPRTLVAVLATHDEAREQATAAARCAAAVRGACPGAPVVVCTGRAELEGNSRVGDAIDRAVTLARQGADALTMDDATRALVEGRVALLGGGSPRQLLGRTSTCVGRDEEVGALVALFDEVVRDRASRAALVLGDAGIGKSRVLHEVRCVLRAREPAPEVWVARADSLSAGAPFTVVSELVRDAARIAEGMPVATRQTKLFARVRRHVRGEANVSRVATFLGEIAGAPLDVADPRASRELRAARRDPQVMGDHVRCAWEDFIAAEAGAHAVVIVAEDLHWGDAPSVKLLERALVQARALPLWVVALARPEVRRVFPELWKASGVLEVALLPLAPRASERLAREALGDDVPREVVDAMVARAQGNAFFIEELVRASRAGRGGEVPESILAMVHARLDELEPDCRRALRAASIFGRAFGAGAVRALLSTSEVPEVGPLVDRLVARELLERRADGLAFRHEYVREAAYATLTARDRVVGHRQAGTWLEARGDASPFVLAEHFERGEDKARAARHYLRAAQQALEGDDLLSAIATAERGVSCGPPPSVLGALRLAQAEAHRWRGAPAEGASHAALALSLLGHGEPAWFDAAAEAMNSNGYAGAYDAVEALAAEASAAPSSTAARSSRIVCLARGAMQLMLAGRYDAAKRTTARVEDLMDEGGALEPHVGAFVHLLRSWSAYYAGDHSAYLVGQEAAARAFADEGDVRSACREWINFGHACMEMGDLARAVALFREWQAPALRLGVPTVVATALQNLGLCLSSLGEHAEARAVEAEALELGERLGNVRLQAGCHEYLAILSTRSGALDAAREHAERALVLARDLPPLRACVLATLADALRAAGEVEGALLRATEAKRIADELGALDEGEARVRLAYAEALLAAGQDGAGREAVLDAKRRIDAVAASLTDPGWRTTYLQGVPENARVTALAAAWRGA